MVIESKKIFKLFTFLVIIAVIIILISVFAPKIEKKIYPKNYSEFVERYSKEYNIDETLIYAIIKTESSFDKNAFSNAGAIGLMQIMPETFDWLQIKMGSGEKLSHDKLYDPEINIKYGVFFLSLLEEEFNDRKLVIAAYHAGRGRVNEWLLDESVSHDGKTISEIPSRTTAHYVSKVTRNIKKYNKLYNKGD